MSVNPTTSGASVGFSFFMYIPDNFPDGEEVITVTDVSTNYKKNIVLNRSGGVLTSIFDGDLRYTMKTVEENLGMLPVGRKYQTYLNEVLVAEEEYHISADTTKFKGNGLIKRITRGTIEQLFLYVEETSKVMQYGNEVTRVVVTDKLKQINIYDNGVLIKTYEYFY